MRAFHEGFKAPINVGRFELSDDSDTAVGQTIGLMAGFVREDRKSPMVRRLARELCRGTPRESMQSVFRWIRSRLRFVHDDDLVSQLHLSADARGSGFANDVAEVLIRPVDMLRMANAQGDCDDFSMLGACLLSACGIPCEFVTVAADAREPSQYSHVYVRAAGVPFDSSHGPVVGWEARNPFGKLQRWDVETGLPSMMMRVNGGMGFLGLCDFEGDPTCDIGGGPISPPDTTSGDNTSITLPFPAIPTGGGGVIPTTGTPQSPTPWWAGDLNSVIGSALTILRAQLAIPPPGTVITTRAGTIATGVQPGTALNVASASSFFSSVPSGVWLAVLAVVGFMLIGGRRRR